VSSVAVQSAHAFGDYYPYWAMRHEHAEAGKLFVVDRTNRGVLPIFFDDNITLDRYQRTHQLIVDCRHPETGAVVDPLELEEAHLVEAAMLDAITDMDYFYSEVQRCETAFLAGR